MCPASALLHGNLKHSFFISNMPVAAGRYQTRQKKECRCRESHLCRTSSQCVACSVFPSSIKQTPHRCVLSCYLYVNSYRQFIFILKIYTLSSGPRASNSTLGALHNSFYFLSSSISNFSPILIFMSDDCLCAQQRRRLFETRSSMLRSRCVFLLLFFSLFVLRSQSRVNFRRVNIWNSRAREKKSKSRASSGLSRHKSQRIVVCFCLLFHFGSSFASSYVVCALLSVLPVPDPEEGS